MTDTPRDRFNAEMARRLAEAKERKARAAAEAEDKASKMAELEEAFARPDLPEHGMIDPIAHKAAHPVVHMSDDIMPAAEFQANLRTYKGRLAIVAYCLHGDVTCEGCLQGIRELLSEPVREAAWN